MSRVRHVALVLVLCVLGAGLTRAARTDAGDAVAVAEDSLVAAATAAGLRLQPPTPSIEIKDPQTVSPGSTADIVATGVFPAGSTLGMRDAGQCFALTKQQITGSQARATVSVLPTALPGAGTLELVPPDNRRAGATAVYVVGKWQFDVTSENGWRVQLTPRAVSPGATELTYAVEFFKGSETKAFQKRDGKFSLASDLCGTKGPSMSISLGEASADDECTRLQARMEDIGKRMSAGGAAQAKALGEYQALQGKMQDCMMKQMAASQELMKKMQDPAAMKQMQDEEDNFGCRNLDLQPGPGGAVTGSLLCGKNVQYPKVTGAMKYLGAR